jgi:DnaJ family protein B protein 4
VTPADVVFVLAEKPHKDFVREGNDLVYTAKITLAESLTDCAVQVVRVISLRLIDMC